MNRQQRYQNRETAARAAVKAMLVRTEREMVEIQAELIEIMSDLGPAIWAAAKDAVPGPGESPQPEQDRPI